MSAHTPAPWRYEEELAIIVGSSPVGPRDCEVASINGSVTFGVDCANARLIAAAPDLLWVVQEIAKALERLTEAKDCGALTVSHWRDLVAVQAEAQRVIKSATMTATRGRHEPSQQ